MLAERQLDGIVLFHPIRIAYVSGFFHRTPSARWLSSCRSMGGLGALIPQLEQEHIAKSPSVTLVKVYPDTPPAARSTRCATSPISSPRWGCRQAARLRQRRLGDVNGYDGPLLSEVRRPDAVRARDIVDKLRAVKSETELRLHPRGAQWGNLAHRLMHDRLALGRNELDDLA